MSKDGPDLRPARLELLLAADPRVAEAHVLEREAETGPVLVAYVALASGTAVQVAQRIAAELGSADTEPVVVPITALPRTADGGVDEPALAGLPVIEPCVLREVDQRVRRMDGIREVAVEMVEELPPAPVPFRFDEASLSISEPSRQAEERFGRADRQRPAVAEGPASIAPADAARTLGDALRETAHAHPSARAVFCGAGEPVERTWDELWQRARAAATGLRALGIAAQTPVVIDLARAVDVATVFWGAQVAGAIPLIAPGWSGDDAHLEPVRRAIGDAVVVTDAEIEGVLAAAADQPAEQPRPEAIAALTLTSGAAGTVRCVAMTHRALLARGRGADRALDASPADVCAAALPLDHIDGLAEHVRCAQLGCTAVLAPPAHRTDDVVRWLELVMEHRATVAALSAHGLRMLANAASASAKLRLDSLRAVVCAGDVLPADAVGRLVASLARAGLGPDALRPAYSISEACGAITIAAGTGPRRVHHLASEPYLDLGPPIAGAKIRIVDAAGAALSEGAVGEIQVGGDVRAAGYFRDDAATDTVFRDDGWVVTGDRGAIVGGHLIAIGRAREVIAVRSASYLPGEIEAAAEHVAGVLPTQVAACATRLDGDGDEAMAVFVATDLPAPERLDLAHRVCVEVDARTGVCPDVTIAVAPGDLRRTASGKLARTALGRALARGELDSWLADAWYSGANRERPAVHLPAWRRCEIARVDDGEPGAAVVLGDGAAADDLRRELDVQGREVLGATDLGRAGARIAEVYDLHGVSVGAAETGEGLHRRTVGSFLRSVKQVNAVAPAQVVRWIVATRNAVAVWPQDAVRPELAPLGAWVRAAAAELPWIAPRLVDMEHVDHNVLWREARAPLDRALEVSYRDGRRLVPGLTAIDARSRGSRGVALERQGLYLVTGGLGPVGQAITERLLVDWNASVVLCGRTAPTADPARAAALARLRELGDVVYEIADVTDADRVDVIVTATEKRLDRSLAGVFHLAGQHTERRVIQSSADDAWQVLAVKLGGARALSRVLESRARAFLCAGSALDAHFPLAGGGPDAAAHRALEAFTHGWHNSMLRPGGALAFSTWSTADVAAAALASDRAKGYRPLAPRAAWRAVQEGLAIGAATVLIGLDRGHRSVLRLERLARPTSGLRVRVAATDLPREMYGLDVADRFGRPIAVAVDHRDSLAAPAPGERSGDHSVPVAPPAEPTGIAAAPSRLPLAAAQRSWLDRAHPGAPALDTRVLTLPAGATGPAISAALAALSDRHPILRARIDLADGWCEVDPGAPAPAVRLEQATGPEDLPAAGERAAAAIDLAAGSVVAAAWCPGSAEELPRLSLTAARAAIDDRSWQIIADELRVLLSAGDLPTAGPAYDHWRRAVASAGQRIGRDLLADQRGPEPPATDPLPPGKGGANARAERELPWPEVTAWARAFGGDEAAARCVALAAFVRASAQVVPRRKLAIEVELDGRHDVGVDVSRAVGPFGGRAVIALSDPKTVDAAAVEAALLAAERDALIDELAGAGHTERRAATATFRWRGSRTGPPALTAPGRTDKTMLQLAAELADGQLRVIVRSDGTITRKQVNALGDAAAEAARTALAAVAGDRTRVAAATLPSAERFRDASEHPGLADHVAITSWVRGELDPDAFLAAITALVTRHEALRSNLVAVSGRIVERVPQAPRFALLRRDLDSVAEGTRPGKARALVDAVLARPFDLTNDKLLRVVLCRLAADHHLVSVIVHRAVCDERSRHIVQRDLWTLYGAAVAREVADLPTLTATPSDAADRARRRVRGVPGLEQLGYWRARLAGARPVALPRKPDVERAPVLGAAHHRATAPARLRAAIVASESPLALLAAGLALALQPQTGGGSACLLCAVDGRHRSDVADVVADLATPIVLRIDLSGDPPPNEIVARARRALADAIDNGDLPILSSRHRDADIPQLEPLLARDLRQISLDYQAADVAGLAPPGLTLEPVDHAAPALDHEIALRAVDRGDELAVDARYAEALFAADTVANLVDDWFRALDRLTAAG